MSYFSDGEDNFINYHMALKTWSLFYSIRSSSLSSVVTRRRESLTFHESFLCRKKFHCSYSHKSHKHTKACHEFPLRKLSTNLSWLNLITRALRKSERKLIFDHEKECLWIIWCLGSKLRGRLLAEKWLSDIKMNLQGLSSWQYNIVMDAKDFF